MAWWTTNSQIVSSVYKEQKLDTFSWCGRFKGGILAPYFISIVLILCVDRVLDAINWQTKWLGGRRLLRLFTKWTTTSQILLFFPDGGDSRVVHFHIMLSFQYCHYKLRNFFQSDSPKREETNSSVYQTSLSVHSLQYLCSCIWIACNQLLWITSRSIFLLSLVFQNNS